MKMDVLVRTGRAAAAAIAVAGVLLLLLLVWIGGELHYGNCVAAAEAQNPAGASRSEAVSGCSRWP